MSEKSIPKIAKYELAEKVSETPVGPVFRGRHVQLGVDVSLRVLSPALMKKFPELQEQFLADARAAGKVEHPCVARVIDCGVDNQLYFRAAQWPAGEPLSRVLEAGSVEPRRALQIARDVAQGLGAGIKEGLLHGEVRPESIVIGEDGEGQARLVDLGLTRLSEAQLEVAAAGGVPRPTAHFRAPEVCIDPAKLEARSDMYSLGAVLFTMLAGVRPFEGASTFDLMRNIADGKRLDLKSEKPNLPPAAIALTLKLLSKEPQDRFSNYEGLVEALEAALKEAELPPAQDLPAEGTAAGAGPARRKGATTKQSPSGGRKGTTRSQGGVSGTKRQGGIGQTTRKMEVRTGTGRQEATAAGGSKAPFLIIGGLVLLAVIGAVGTVLMLDKGTPNKPDTIGGGGDSGSGGPGGGGETGGTVGGGGDPAIPTPVDPQKQKVLDALAAFETRVTGAGPAGDQQLEQELQAFVDANVKYSEVGQALGWIGQLRVKRMEAAWRAAVSLSGQARLAAVDAFIQDFPKNPHSDEAAQLRQETAADLQTGGWRSAYDEFDKALGKLEFEQIDERRALMAEYLGKIQGQAGNPYIDTVKKKQSELEKDAASRLKSALDAADRDMQFNNFESALDKITTYKTRFHDQGNHAKADDKAREIATKAFAFFGEAKKAALAKMVKDVNSRSARIELDNAVVKLKGVGTYAEDAKAFGESLKVFDELHKRAANNEAISNVQNRKMPECLYVQGKTGLSIREMDDKRIKMTEGGTPVTFYRNWADLTLAERVTVYTYLLQPDGEDMPAEIQALLDKATETLKP